MEKSNDFISGLLYCVFAVLSIPALVLLIVFAAKYGGALKIVSSTIYGSALFLLLLFSSLNNWLHLGKNGKRVFRKLNHICIYFFIAATYTPICLVLIKGAWGWSIFGVICFLAILCIVFNSIWVNYPKILYSCIYIAMSLIIFIAIKPLMNNLITYNILYSVKYLIIGGLLFTISAIIYSLNSYKTNILLKQTFNILVLSGIVCQYCFIFRYILPI